MSNPPPAEIEAARERLSVSTPGRKSLLDHLIDMASSMAFPAPNLFEQDAADLRVLLQAARRESDDSARDAKVTRFELIDHRANGVDARRAFVACRAFVAYDCRVERSYQDDGRTLKVFVNDRDAARQSPTPGATND